ncbi:hypothetical protein QTO20_24065 [Serratia marcescens]|uniref:hypothetical protein n=1 Tax=Serratia marcescens TaxID=615 RepID=UPI003896D7B8
MGEICQINWIKKGKKMKKLPTKTGMATVLILAVVITNARASLFFDANNNKIVGVSAWDDISGHGTPGDGSVCFMNLYIIDKMYTWRYMGPECDQYHPEETQTWMKNLIANGVQLQYVGNAVGVETRIEIGNIIGGARAWRHRSRDVSVGSPVACSMDGDIVIDHGLVPEDGAGGSTANTTATIGCDGAAEVKLTIKPSNVRMTNGMNARVLVQGKASKKIKVGEGETTVEISSELTGKPEQAGAATGSTVLQYEVL